LQSIEICASEQWLADSKRACVLIADNLILNTILQISLRTLMSKKLTTC